MKRIIVILLLLTGLWGCSAEPVYETIGNVWDNPQLQSTPASIELAVEGAQMAVMETDGNRKSYQVGNWMLWTEVRDGGDVLATMRDLTGLDDPQIISYPVGQYQCHETAWAVENEEGERVVRTAVISQGQYHYCLSIKAPQEEARQVGSFFTQLLKSVHINDTAE